VSPTKEGIQKLSDIGAKYDDGKLDLTLVPPELEEAVALVMMYGAKKYARHNWKEVNDAPRRYFAAMERHIKAFKRGNELDPESGLPHLSHAATCMAFLLYFKQRVDIGTWRETEPISLKDEVLRDLVD
jgi:hypothetical protein